MTIFYPEFDPPTEPEDVNLGRYALDDMEQALRNLETRMALTDTKIGIIISILETYSKSLDGIIAILPQNTGDGRES